MDTLAHGLAPGFVPSVIPELKAPSPPAKRAESPVKFKRRRGGPVNVDQRALQNEKRKATANARRSYAEKFNKLPDGIVIGSAISSIDTRTFLRTQDYININIATIASHDAAHGATSDAGTVNDARMGPIKPDDQCVNCGQINCPGHEGVISFESTPMIHVLYSQMLVNSLQVVCQSCGGLLINRDTYYAKGYNKYPHTKVLKIMADECKNLQCLRETRNRLGEVLTCNKNPVIDTSSLKEQGVLKRTTKKKRGEKQAESSIFPISDIFNILDRISDDDAYLMGFRNTHPRNLISFGQIVPPRAIRPPNNIGTKVYTDALTYQLKQIVQTSFRVSRNENSLYQVVRSLYFETNTKKGNNKALLAITPRIQGKKAVLRENIQGKRNNVSARGVANGAADSKLDEIKIPLEWMNNITKPIKVTDFNYDFVLELIRNRRIKKFKDQNDITREYRYDHPPELRVGDKYYRYLMEDDYMMCNRQPTLHKASCMGYKMKGVPYDTVGLPLAVTPAMNADFDGDEFNGWFTQEPDAEAEVEYIISTKRNIMSTENSRPMIGCVMNTITGSYLLTGYGNESAVDEILFDEIVELLPAAPNMDDFTGRLMLLNVDKLSGYGVYSLLFPADFYYDNKGVKIVNGVMVAGRIDKSHIGNTSRSIVQDLHKRYGEEAAYNFINNATMLVGKWLIEEGFSVSITDFFVLAEDENGRLYNKNEKFLEDELAKIDLRLAAVGEESSDPLIEEARERSIVAIVNSARKIGMDLANQTLSKDNQIAVMTEKGAGTKGAMANIGQMMGAVSQQFKEGRRFERKLSNNTRTLPVYYRGEDTPESRGFIRSSFFKGLTPTEMFHSQEGARESILDTALKTSETGEMQRYMTKSFENIIVANDGSVRNTSGALFSTVYGGCGYAVAEQLNVDKTGQNDTASFLDLDDVVAELNGQYGYVKADLPIKPSSAEIEVTWEEPQFEEWDTINTHPLTKFEKARIIGARAMQLFNNAPPIIDPGKEVDSFKIAQMEYATGKLEICVLRRFGSRTERVYPTLENI